MHSANPCRVSTSSTLEVLWASQWNVEESRRPLDTKTESYHHSLDQQAESWQDLFFSGVWYWRLTSIPCITDQIIRSWKVLFYCHRSVQNNFGPVSCNSLIWTGLSLPINDSLSNEWFKTGLLKQVTYLVLHLSLHKGPHITSVEAYPRDQALLTLHHCGR